MFNFQNLEVYKKSKSFHIACKKVIVDGKLEKYVIDQLGRASFSVRQKYLTLNKPKRLSLQIPPKKF